MTGAPDPQDWKRDAARRGLVPLALVLVGIAVMIVGGAAFFWGAAILVLGLVVATSLVFLEVGFSEDRERRREAQVRADREREAARKAAPPRRRLRAKRPPRRP